MPRKYPDETKPEAVGILQIHDATGVHERALRRWRGELRKKQNDFMSEKTFHSDIKRTQNQVLAEKTVLSSAAKRRGYPPPENHTISVPCRYLLEI